MLVSAVPFMASSSMSASPLGFQRVKVIALSVLDLDGSFLDSEGNKLWFCSPVEPNK